MPVPALTQAGEVLLLWRASIIAFLYDNWPGLTLRPWQERFLETLVDPRALRVALLCPRDGGKSFIIAVACLWWLCLHPGSLVLIVAPIARQVEVGIMVEVASLWSKSESLRALFPGWRLGASTLETTDPQWRLMAVATDRPERIEAPHSPQPALIAIDEARGLDDEFLKSLEGILAHPEARLIACSVAGAPSGFFYDAFHGNHGGWDRSIEITLDDLPHVKAHYQKLVKRYGAGDLTLQRQYENKFADAAEFSIFTPEMLLPLVGLDCHAGDPWPGLPRDRVIGIDLATRGDDTVACYRAGRNIERFEVLPHVENEMALAELLATRIRGFRADMAVADEIGLGAGICGRLEQILTDPNHPARREIRLERWNAAKSANDGERYQNRKTEVCLGLHKLATDEEIGLPDGPLTERLIQELCSLQLVEGGNGRVRVEDPRRSPDVADAFIAAHAFDERAAEPTVVEADIPGA